ncbi:MAG: HlyC/CorC family transporter [Candidatus Omnitrophica bacterium]|nr:HlyC/CorC family transporter [Candidatus Omnitrophota bacterium]
MANPVIWKGALLLFLLGLSGFFSASETTLFSLSRIHLKRISDRHPHHYTLIVSLLDRPRRTLTTILIGNTLVNVAASALAASLAIHFFGDMGLTIAVGGMTFLLLIFGEINPKTVATRNAERLSPWVAPFIEGVAILTLPIRRLTRGITDLFLDLLTGESYASEPFITAHELKTLVSIGEKEGVLDRGETDMIQAVFEFGELRVSEIMTPRVDIVGCPEGASSSEVKKLLQSANRTKVPVYEGSLDTIVGVLSTKDFLLSQEENWRKLIRPATYVPGSKKIGDLLSEFQKDRESLAIVIDEYGGTSGLVTLEDVLEEIVGEIRDEYDVEEEHFQMLDPHAFRVSGRASIRELQQRLGVTLTPSDAQRVAGFLLTKLGRLPKAGEMFKEGEVLFTVEEVRRNQIRRVTVRRSVKR